jgi:hypothetical protein
MTFPITTDQDAILAMTPLFSVSCSVDDEVEKMHLMGARLALTT